MTVSSIWLFIGRSNVFGDLTKVNISRHLWSCSECIRRTPDIVNTATVCIEMIFTAETRKLAGQKQRAVYPYWKHGIIALKVYLHESPCHHNLRETTLVKCLEMLTQHRQTPHSQTLSPAHTHTSGNKPIRKQTKHFETHARTHLIHTRTQTHISAFSTLKRTVSRSIRQTPQGRES